MRGRVVAEQGSREGAWDGQILVLPETLTAPPDSLPQS